MEHVLGYSPRRASPQGAEPAGPPPSPLAGQASRTRQRSTPTAKQQAGPPAPERFTPAPGGQRVEASPGTHTARTPPARQHLVARRSWWPGSPACCRSPWVCPRAMPCSDGTGASLQLCRPRQRAPTPGRPVAHAGTPRGEGAVRGSALSPPALQPCGRCSADIIQLPVATARSLSMTSLPCLSLPHSPRFSKENENEVCADPKRLRNLLPWLCQRISEPQNPPRFRMPGLHQ